MCGIASKILLLSKINLFLYLLFKQIFGMENLVQYCKFSSSVERDRVEQQVC